VTYVRVLVGTSKGASILTSDGSRNDWKVDGPHFGGEEIYHVNGTTPITCATRPMVHWSIDPIGGPKVRTLGGERSQDPAGARGGTWHPPCRRIAATSLAFPVALASRQPRFGVGHESQGPRCRTSPCTSRLRYVAVWCLRTVIRRFRQLAHLHARRVGAPLLPRMRAGSHTDRLGRAHGQPGRLRHGDDRR
jgi:hypothetical protein